MTLEEGERRQLFLIRWETKYERERDKTSAFISCLSVALNIQSILFSLNDEGMHLFISIQ